MERWKNDIVEIIEELFSPEGIYERNDVPVRVLEGLTEQKNFLSKPFSTKQVINECGVKFQIDIEQGQKTGFFLDQKENRMELEHIVKGASVLDCFTYTGSFAMNAAFYGAKEVIGYDISEWAIEQAKQNAALNKFNQCHFECVNAFDKLPELVKAKKQFDIVVLDPPAFTKNRSGIQSALRGYKEINLRGMRLTKPGGFLITFSCSHYMTPDYFFSTLHEAAYDAGKTIRQVKYLQQAKDHPVMWNVPETNYLKGYVLQVI
jgi:23S rRNA (cytosine1962-C5)-methyltransferase